MWCLLTVLALLGPRAAILVWFLVDPARWQHAFSGFYTFLAPLLGALFLPWTTLAVVLVAPYGVVQAGGWLWIVVGIVIDVAGYAASRYGNRQRVAT